MSLSTPFVHQMLTQEPLFLKEPPAEKLMLMKSSWPHQKDKKLCPTKCKQNIPYLKFGI